MPTVKISDDNFAVLQKFAVPFEDTPDSVLTRLLDRLGLRGAADPAAVLDALLGDTVVSATGSEPKLNAKAVERVVQRRKRDLTPQRAFRPHIIAVLKQRGGAGRIEDVLEDVFARVDGHLKDDDFIEVKSGEERWRNAVRWERKALVDEGLMQRKTEWGWWALTDEGHEWEENSS